MLHGCRRRIGRAGPSSRRRQGTIISGPVVNLDRPPARPGLAATTVKRPCKEQKTLNPALDSCEGGRVSLLAFLTEKAEGFLHQCDLK